MGAAERLLEVAPKLKPDELAQVLHLAEYLAKRPAAVDPSLGLAWLNALPEEDEALTPEALANFKASHVSNVSNASPRVGCKGVEGRTPSVWCPHVRRASGASPSP